MCIAIVVPQGVSLPSDDILYRCFRTNPDGAGYAWADGKKHVHFRKGFMSPEPLIKALRREVPDGTACLIHFRIGTHGGDGPEFTHPFPVSPVLKDMYLLRGRTEGQVLVHNGVITGLGKDGVLSDTQEFTLLYAKRRVGLKKAGCSRVAMLSPDGSYVTHGDWEESEGVLYSNDSYVPYESTWGIRCGKSKNTFVGLRKLKDEDVPVVLADTDVMSVGQLMSKKFPGATGVFADTSENVYVGLPGYSRPVCIGTLEFGWGAALRTPMREESKSYSPREDFGIVRGMDDPPAYAPLRQEFQRRKELTSRASTAFTTDDGVALAALRKEGFDAEGNLLPSRTSLAPKGAKPGYGRSSSEYW